MRHDAERDQESPPDPDLEHRLLAERGVPSAAFRGALARRLAEEDPGYESRPARLFTTASGLALLAVVILAAGLLQALGRL